jgi:hypothetical protein
MAILLISWACTSTVFCLAFLAAAGRSVPRIEAQMASGSKTDSRQEARVVLGNAKPASRPSEAALPSSCQAA